MAKKSKEKSKKGYYAVLSTPSWVYLIAVSLSILFICISYCTESSIWYIELLKNLGYGIAASTGVSLLIDIGSTKRERKQECMIYARMTADLKNACKELPSEVYTAVYEAFGYDSMDKYTFDEWICRLFTNNANHYERQKKEIKCAVQAISLIKQKAVELCEVMKAFLDNECVTEELEKNVKQLISFSSRIERELNRENYDECKNIITKEMKKCILKIFEDLEVDYTREYNEEEYLEK